MTDTVDRTQTPPTIPTDTVTFAFTVPNSVAWLSCVIDGLQRLAYPGGWVSRGGISEEDAADRMIEVIGSNQIITGEGLMPVGTVVPMLRDTLPDGFLWMDGQQRLIADHPELAAVLPAEWIGLDTFTLPDMSGRVPRGKETGQYTGQQGGADSHWLTVSNLPDHEHNYGRGVDNVYHVAVPTGVTPTTQRYPGSDAVYLGPYNSTGGLEPPNLDPDPVPTVPEYSAFRFAIVSR